MLLENITSCSCKQKVTLALKIEGKLKKQVNNDSYKRNTQMNDPLVKTVDSHLEKITLRKNTIEKSMTLEPKFTFAQLVRKFKKILHEPISNDKIKTKVTFQTEFNKKNTDVDNLTAADVRAMKHDMNKVATL